MRHAVAAWLDCLATGPLTYPSLQALSRLRDVGDDALVLAGESWAELDDRARERRAYERVLKEIPGGDMAPEARRRLIVLAFTQDRLDDALELADAGLVATTKIELRERAKLHYFRGRPGTAP